MRQEEDQTCPCNRLEYGEEFKCINHFGLQFDVVTFSDLNALL